GEENGTKPKVDHPIDIEDIWKRDLREIAEFRKSEDAPVDTMGYHLQYDKDAAPEDRRFQILVAAIISRGTKDEVASAAMQRVLAAGCTLKSGRFLRMNEAEAVRLLHGVSSAKEKYENIIVSAAVIWHVRNGIVPNTLDGLCRLEGVTVETAILVLQAAFRLKIGIAVDTHVHRIVNRLGWMKTADHDETRKKLEELLPKEEWARVNKLLVGYGQQICLPVKPKCFHCPLKKTCPSSTFIR
ncbi:hypothetical protein PRIPAC_94517, partial [Pristionchus pacificus]